MLPEGRAHQVDNSATLATITYMFLVTFVDAQAEAKFSTFLARSAQVYLRSFLRGVWKTSA